jgi:hypothetical protein
MKERVQWILVVLALALAVATAAHNSTFDGGMNARDGKGTYMSESVFRNLSLLAFS